MSKSSRSRGKSSKALSERAHLRRRAAERFNIVLTKDGIRDIVNQIRSGKTEFVGRDSYRVSKHIVNLGSDETKAICVYDRLRKQPVTLLTMDMLEESVNANSGLNSGVFPSDECPIHKCSYVMCDCQDGPKSTEV